MIAEHADRPFVLGYRVSPEEAGEGAIRMDDTYQLIDAIIEAGVDYVHASLFSVLDARPMESTGDKTVAQLVVAHVAGRVPVIAAGGGWRSACRCAGSKPLSASRCCVAPGAASFRHPTENFC